MFETGTSASCCGHIDLVPKPANLIRRSSLPYASDELLASRGMLVLLQLGKDGLVASFICPRRLSGRSFSFMTGLPLHP